MRNRQKGFTIIELLLAIVLLGIIMPALFLGVNALANLNDRARDLTIVSIVAENKIESLRSIGYNSLPVGTVNFTSELPALLGKPNSASYTITESGGNKTVVLTLSYRDYSRTRTVTYKSIISETGVGQ